MSNKTLKYTLREIMIVIIGITAAFSMNKCADNYSDKKLRVEYLKNIKSDIEIDKTKLAAIDTIIDLKIEVCNNLLSLLNNKTNQNLELLDMVLNIVKYENFNPKSGTYRTLINSGDLKLIGYFDLKSAIQTHYINYDELSATYNRHKSLIKDYLGNYLINYTDYDQLASNKTPFLDTVKLKNIIRALKTTLAEKEATNDAINSCNDLLSILSTKIN